MPYVLMQYLRIKIPDIYRTIDDSTCEHAAACACRHSIVSYRHQRMRFLIQEMKPCKVLATHLER